MTLLPTTKRARSRAMRRGRRMSRQYSGSCWTTGSDALRKKTKKTKTMRTTTTRKRGKEKQNMGLMRIRTTTRTRARTMRMAMIVTLSSRPLMSKGQGWHPDQG